MLDGDEGGRSRTPEQSAADVKREIGDALGYALTNGMDFHSTTHRHVCVVDGVSYVGTTIEVVVRPPQMPCAACGGEIEFEEGEG